MLTAATVHQMIANAFLMAMSAHAVDFALRPGKLLGWIRGWANDLNEYAEGVRFIGPVVAFLTHSIRECWACLAGQLCLAYFLIMQGKLSTDIDVLALCLFVATGITCSLIIHKLFLK